ncbi:nad -binding protein [Ophiostoma piceae UAMH 11346]|uniref:Nad-binding protein n=1 Tax=Ophiostoma piceae (strain UAMH 11346) TaxID=1262450 RepID=S3CQR1_OPHP1|nr:nad -binding protein [Ophiostoma piceae UAMH 11346]
MSAQPKTVAFIGASGGIGLATLRQTLAAGHRCIALCRDPSKLSALLPHVDLVNPAYASEKLFLVKGNAHDIDAVSQCLVAPSSNGQPGRLVDVVVSSIGGKMIFSKMALDDPNVCEKGMSTLLEAIALLRARGVASNNSIEQTPRIVAISTTGISQHGRDVPLAFMPMYHGMLRVPHADKRAMENRLVSSGELYALVRPSFLTDDDDPASPIEHKPSDASTSASISSSLGAGLTKKQIKDRTKGELKEHEKTARDDFKVLKDKYKKEGVYQSIRVGIEDPVAGRRVSSAVGYTISRADAGRWMAEHLVLPAQLSDTYARKIATITY